MYIISEGYKAVTGLVPWGTKAKRFIFQLYLHISTLKVHISILKSILEPKVYILVPFERVLP